MAGESKAPVKKKRAPRRKRASKSAGLEPRDCTIGITPDLAPAAEQVRRAEGSVIASYRDPLGGNALLLAVLPIDRVQPTPFQRDLSDTHHKRLAGVIQKIGRFLDPVIAVPAPEGGFWTPNGYHRLEAMRRLGARSITALVIPEPEIAQQILALNTEKAHNLRDRSLEVIRMARSLAKRESQARESQFAAEFEAPELLTLGIVYERSSRFAGGAYSAFLKKVDRFSERTLSASLREREDSAARLLDIDAQVKKLIAALQARGFKSPYLRNYVVARINPVRFHKPKKGDTQPPMPLAQALTRMSAAAKTFKLESVSNADLAWVAVGAGAQE